MSFSAAHVLPTDTKCGRLHGHNWKVEVGIEGKIKEGGVVIDFCDVKLVIADLDHKIILRKSYSEEAITHSNSLKYRINGKIYIFPTEDVIFISDEPTCENIARLIWRRLDKLVSSPKVIEVKVWESEYSWSVDKGGQSE